MSNIKSKIIAVIMLISFTLPMFAQSVASILNEQDALVDTITLQITEMKNKILSLSLQVTDNEELNKKLLEEISATQDEMLSMKANIESLKAALISNKDDTSNMIDLFAGALEDIAKLESDLAILRDTIERKNQQLRNASIFFNIAVPTLGLIAAVPSVKLMMDGDQTGFYWLMADVGVVLTLELTWHIGRGLEAKIPTLVLW